MFEFQSSGTFEVKGDKCFTVLNPTECHDFDHLIGNDVLVDGKKETVTGVERFAHAPPWRKLETIGLLVKT